MQRPDLVPLGSGVASIISRRSPGKESANEDSAALIQCGEDACVLVVADGMGGGPAGQDAARLAIEAVSLAIEEGAASGLLLRTAILNGIDRANREVAGLGLGAATTLAAAEISAGEVRPYHVGDSFVMVLGRGGKLKLQTMAHSPVGYGIEAGLLDEVEAIHHEDRHLVSNMIGMDTMRIDVGPAMLLAPNDTVLLATDGLSDNLHVAEIVETARKGSPDQAVLRLADLATRRMLDTSGGEPSKPDDMTLVLFRPQPWRR
jgi:serine/threonine protein phosphatase PrpC